MKWAATSVAAGCRYALLKVSPGGTLYPLGLTPTTAHKYPVGSRDDLFEVATLMGCPPAYHVYNGDCGCGCYDPFSDANSLAV